MNSRYMSVHGHTVAGFSIITEVGDMDFLNLSYSVYCH